MKTTACKLVSTSILLLFCLITWADYLEVTRDATIIEEPRGEAAIILRVEIGAYLVLAPDVEQINGYYYVQVPNSNQYGWIYRTFVRRYPEDLGTSETVTVSDPLAESTYTLTSADREWASYQLELGKPQAVYERVREGYVLAQDARLKIPLWVQYILTPENLTGNIERTEDFRPDNSIPNGARSELSDYSGSGFDRGHMAPAGDMTRSTKVMSESFLLSNIAPQVGIGFNRHIWENLESAIRGWVQQRGKLTIITGPIFKPENGRISYQVIGNDYVAVPTHFYKIVVDAKNANAIEVLAFILPNENLTGRNISEFLTSVDEIERLTGLNFLEKLPDQIENEIEALIATEVW